MGIKFLLILGVGAALLVGGKPIPGYAQTPASTIIVHLTNNMTPWGEGYPMVTRVNLWTVSPRAQIGYCDFNPNIAVTGISSCAMTVTSAPNTSLYLSVDDSLPPNNPPTQPILCPSFQINPGASCFTIIVNDTAQNDPSTWCSFTQNSSCTSTSIKSTPLKTETKEVSPNKTTGRVR